MHQSRTAVVFLALLGAVTGPGAAPQQPSTLPGPPTAPALAPPLPAGPAPDLDLVFTGQVAGYVEPCG
jgi:hypothetical protein